MALSLRAAIDVVLASVVVEDGGCGGGGGGGGDVGDIELTFVNFPSGTTGGVK